MRILQTRITTFTMSLLAKGASLLIIIIPFLFFSCEDPGEVGLNLNTDNSFTVGFKEFSLASSNVNLDSIRTSNQRVLLAGEYTDPIFGDVSSIGYTQMWFQDFFEVPENAVYDSLSMKLQYVYLYGNNNTGPKTFKVHKLADSLKFSTVYYNFETVTFEKQIGEATVELDPNTGEEGEISFRLDQTFGLELFDLLTDSTSLVFSNRANFLSYFY